MFDFITGAFARENLQWSIPVALAILLIVGYLVGLGIFWFSPPQAIEGKVIDKSTEITHRSGKDSSSTTIERFIQLEDGSTYAVLWTNHYDQIAVGKTYDFTIKGFRLYLLGWRIFTPTITNVQTPVVLKPIKINLHPSKRLGVLL